MAQRRLVVLPLLLLVLLGLSETANTPVAVEAAQRTPRVGVFAAAVVAPETADVGVAAVSIAALEVSANVRGLLVVALRVLVAYSCQEGLHGAPLLASFVLH